MTLIILVCLHKHGHFIIENPTQSLAWDLFPPEQQHGILCMCVWVGVHGSLLLVNPHNPCSPRCSSIRDLNVSLISGDLLLSIFIWVPMELKLGNRWSLWVTILALNFCGGHMRVNQLTICTRNSMLRYGINGVYINLFPSSQEPRPIEVLEKWEHYPVQEPRWQAQI